MHKVEIRLFASLRKYHPNSGNSEAFTMELDDKTSLANLVDKLKIARQEIGVLMVNSTWQKENYLLQDEDRVGLFPLIGGG
ncbi:MAG: MoaD/ThiS family protein [Anaerolineales bacterium]|nr:MoaD/ThiS family protein [Anaerolineales bacterium]